MLLRHTKKLLCKTVSTSLISPGNYISNAHPVIILQSRTYSNKYKTKPTRKVKPLHIEKTFTKNQLKKQKELEMIGLENYHDLSKDPEAFEDLENPEGNFEPDLEKFGDAYFEYQQERYYYRQNKTRQRLIRKNFKHLQTKEENLLTWAEKQNICHLHSQNSEEWSPERLASAFPISAAGVNKLVRNPPQKSTPEEILRHDQKIKRKIERIKSGEIELTPELEQKLEIRDKVPFVIGELLNDDTTEPPKPLGQFARIVASQKKILEAEEKVSQFQQQMFDKENDQEWELFANEMNKLHIGRTEHMTLSEFENKLQESSLSSDSKIKENNRTKDVSVIESSKNKPLKESVPEIRYLLNMNKSKTEFPNVSQVLEERRAEEDASKYASSSKQFIKNYVHKFKSTEENPKDPEAIKEFEDVPKIGVEDGNLYIYDPKLGYQKPFESPDNLPLDKIKIPKHLKLSDGTYKVNDSYYDEHGNFLYRVV